MILSHLHWDHSGAATRTEGERLVPAFPNAVVYIQEAELAHACAPHERDRVSYGSENWEPLAFAPGAWRRSLERSISGLESL